MKSQKEEFKSEIGEQLVWSSPEEAQRDSNRTKNYSSPILRSIQSRGLGGLPRVDFGEW